MLHFLIDFIILADNSGLVYLF